MHEHIRVHRTTSSPKKRERTMTDTNASLAPLQQQLDDALRRFSPLTTQDLAMLHRVVTFRTFARGECFVEAGAPATESALVLEGVFRERREMPGEVPITVCFSAEGDLVGPVADLIAKRPRASSHIAALTTATVAVVKWADFRALCAQALAWERLYTTVIARLFLAKVEPQRQLLSMSAA